MNLVRRSIFYIPDYRLNKSPIFCAKDFSDPKFPSANNYVIENTKKAVEEWQDKIEKYTKTNGNWKFEFKKFLKIQVFQNLDVTQQ